ncbi:hypothetical protein SOVF_054020 [Spinacia oleracea]|uniref:Transmembrane protein n=1 Tax=Spinacia oleracea TaxID=3562 RepID=A0ABM3RT38_SPIOL|nr:uncharacterized protein LOC110784293 [Spinacia oleracea]KNA20263.1 hypothetical protein SOVF_054020 [Spinacia oleracea]
MASLFPKTSYHTNNTQPSNKNWVLFPIFRTSILSLPPHFPSSINHSFTSPIHLYRPFHGSTLNPNRSILRSSLVPPPPPGKETQRFTGTVANISRLWDTVQILFAVFFWMSLFFWASATDRTKRGRGNKKDRFRK